MNSLLEIREAFHIAFLRQFATKVKSQNYSVKGGVNLRLFFGSIRYSEDIDFDLRNLEVFRLKDIVLNILSSNALGSSLNVYGIEKIIPPNIEKAKQTETVQRFKVHLITKSGEDFFTKIEFSRRPFKEEPVSEFVNFEILNQYKQAPLIISHYPLSSAVYQKIVALSDRANSQARDLFDLNVLRSHLNKDLLPKILAKIPAPKIKKALDSIFSMNFEIYRDTVCAYLSQENYELYSKPQVWDDIKLKVVSLIKGEL